MPSPIRELIEGRVANLPRGLRDHTRRVWSIALELAGRHGIDGERVGLAALAHDLARAKEGEYLLRRARELGLPVHPVEEWMPLLLHGPVAAEELRREAGLSDPEVYEAIYWHSTGQRGMGPVARVVFLADKLDPEKADRYPYLGELKALAHESLERALLLFLTREMESLLRMGMPIHPASLEAWNELLLKGRDA